MCLYLSLFFFFFSSRRRHTRFKCDWSSDVCSSDLFRENFVGSPPNVVQAVVVVQLGERHFPFFGARNQSHASAERDQRRRRVRRRNGQALRASRRYPADSPIFFQEEVDGLPPLIALVVVIA